MLNKNLIKTLLLSLTLAILLSACGDVEDRKTKYFNRGMELYQQGNYTKARLEFKNVLQIDPKDAQGYFMFASIEEKEQNWRKAYALFLRATELDPTHLDAHVHLGRLYALSGAAEKALESAATVLAIDANNAGAQVLKALAEARLGNKSTAIALAESTVQAHPENVDSISLLASLYSDQGNEEKAIAMVQQGLEKHPDNIALNLLLGKFYEKAGNTEGTVEMLKKIIALKPDDSSHRKRLAGYLHSKGLVERAEQVLQETIAAFPDSAEAKLTLAKYLRQRGEKAKSENVLREFINKSPEDYELHLGLANFFVDAGKRDDAMDILGSVAEKAGETDNAHKARTKMAALLLTDKKFDQASQQVEVVLGENAADKEALLIRAGISLASNDPDKGIADLRALLKEDPGHVRALRLKARAHLVKKEIELARQALEKAIEAEPQEVNANVELVQLLILSGDYDGAVAVLEKMRRFAPNDQSILLAMAKIRVKQQNWKAVAQLAETMIEVNAELALGYHYQGLVLQAEKQLDASSEAFEQSLQRNPNATEPLIGLAKNLLSQGKSDEALKRVQKVIDVTPKHYLAQNLKGEIHLSQKQFEQARTSFSKAIEIQPKWPTPYRNLAKIDMFNKDITSAIGQLKSGYESSSDPSLGVEYAGLLQRNGDDDTATAVYEQLLKKSPGLAVVANNYAMMLIKESPDQAVLDKALSLVQQFELSNNPIFLDSLGWIQFKRNELVKAVKILERAHGMLEERPMPEISYHLAEAYAATERKPEAVKLLETVVASNGRFEGMDRAKELLQQLQ